MNPDPTIQGEDSSAELFGGNIMHHLSRSTFTAAAISLGSLSAAFAADLGPRPAYKAIPIATVYDWTGLYVGAHAGWAGADRTFERTFVGGTVVINPGFSQHSSGFAGGGQIGFNRQAGNWVWGLEAELTGTTLQSSTTVAVPTLPLITQTYDVNIDWTASLTGRLGYAWDRWMLYGKGGAAVMYETYSLTAPGLVIPDSPYHRAKVAHLGWTVGGGVENAFHDNWSWKAEYNYMRFDGNDSITNALSVATVSGIKSYTDVNLHLVKAGINYRFGVPGPVAVAGSAAIYKAPITNIYDWTGLYVGGHTGWASTERNFATIIGVVGNIFTPPFQQKPSGFLGGGQVGFNRQAGNWVFGLEADASGTNLGASTTVVDPSGTIIQTYDVSIDWTATLAGRVGYAWNRWMLYGKGGGALMRETTALASPVLGIRTDARATRAGWTAGVGIENAFLENWSWKAEYNYMRFDSTKTVSNPSVVSPAAGIATETSVDVHALKLGINYRLGNYGVIAKH